MIRLLVMTAPAAAVVAVLKPDVLPALLRVGGAAIVNTLVVGALAGLHSLLVVSLFRPDSGIDLWLALLVTGVVTVVLWAVARPFRRLVSMVSLTREQFGGIVPGAGTGPMSRVWQRMRGGEVEDRQARWWEERRGGAAPRRRHRRRTPRDRHPRARSGAGHPGVPGRAPRSRRRRSPPWCPPPAAPRCPRAAAARGPRVGRRPPLWASPTPSTTARSTAALTPSRCVPAVPDRSSPRSSTACPSTASTGRARRGPVRADAHPVPAGSVRGLSGAVGVAAALARRGSRSRRSACWRWSWRSPWGSDMTRPPAVPTPSAPTPTPDVVVGPGGPH